MVVELRAWGKPRAIVSWRITAPVVTVPFVGTVNGVGVQALRYGCVTGADG